jgi:FkbM family methyltransferase
MKHFEKTTREVLVEQPGGLAFYQTNLHHINAEAWVPYGHLGYSLCSFGLYEMPVMGWIEKLGPGQLLLDVGANIGLMSLAAAARGCDVMAFEPEERAREVLEMNFDLNGIPRDRICAAAIGRTWGMAKLYIAQAIAQSTTAVEKNLPFQEVSVIPLDDLVRQVPDAIKIDVEGAELDVIEGAKEVLESMRPGGWVIVETHNKAKTSGRLIANHLDGAGFQTHRLVGRGELLPVENAPPNGQIIGIK